LNDLNAGEPHLDGEGEYTPPESNQPAENEKDDDDVQEKQPHPDDSQDQQEATQEADDGMIDESDVELPSDDAVELTTPAPPGEDEPVVPPADELLKQMADEDEDKKVGPSLEDAVAEPVVEDIPIVDDATEGEEPKGETSFPAIEEGTGIDLNKTVEAQVLSQSQKPGFDTEQTQDARSDTPQEGGIARNRTTGNQFHSRGKPEGEQLKPGGQVQIDRSEMYEVAGFTASYEKVRGQGMVNVEIRDYFLDIETVIASVNGDKYLMPLPQGYKIVEIVAGAPTISYKDKMIFEYINGKWRRK